MKEVPLLMSGPMVVRTLAGEKTMTRRVKGLGIINNNPDQWKLRNTIVDGNDIFYIFTRRTEGSIFTQIIHCPYGIKGDHLYVRENLYWDQEEGWEYQDGSSVIVSGPVHPILTRQKKSIPSIHMPRCASRITLENVSNPRIERVCDITESDAVLEGFKPGSHLIGDGKFEDVLEDNWTARDDFFSYITKLDGKEIVDKNQWVWVLDYRVVK